MSKLLLDENPLLVMPQLATKIGLNEAIILQQIHYWLEINRKANKNFKDGNYWVYNSFKDWKINFPFWSESTIKRTVSKLERYNLLVVGNYNKLKIDRTKWYRINYETLEKLEKLPLGQIDPTKMSICTAQDVNLIRPLPENKAENKAENNLTSGFDKPRTSDRYKTFKELKQELIKYTNSKVIYFIQLYFEQHKRKFDKNMFVIDSIKEVTEKAEILFNFIEKLESYTCSQENLIEEYTNSFFELIDNNSIYNFINKDTALYILNKLEYLDITDVYEAGEGKITKEYWEVL
jgi:hypothetical protein